MVVYTPGGGPSSNTQSADALISNFPASRTGRNEYCCLSHPVYCVLSQHPELRQSSCTFLLFMKPLTIGCCSQSSKAKVLLSCNIHCGERWTRTWNVQNPSKENRTGEPGSKLGRAVKGHLGWIKKKLLVHIVFRGYLLLHLLHSVSSSKCPVTF